MYKRSRNQVVKMIANAEVSAHEKWNYGEYEQPTTTLKTLEKKKTAPTQKTPSSLSYIEIDGQQITDPLSTASAFYYNFTKIQLSANSAASADDDLQADMNATLLDFFKTRIDDSTQFNVPLTTTKQVEENIKRIGGNKATGLDGFGITIIKLALLAISLKAQLTLYNTSIQSMTPSFRQTSKKLA